MIWDPSDWTALVEERKIVGWLVKIPEEREMALCTPISMNQITALEEAKKKDPNAQIVLQDEILKHKV